MLPRGLQLFLAQGLGQRPQHGQAQGAAQFLDRVQDALLLAGHHQHRDLPALVLQLRDQFHPVHDGHVQVDQHHIGLEAQHGQLLQRLHSVAGLVNQADAELATQLRRVVALHGTVVHHHDGLQT